MFASSTTIRAATSPYGSSPAYERAIAGLQTFDRLSDMLRERQDGVQRAVRGASAYPAPRYGERPTTSTGAAGCAATLVGALASYAATDAGRKGIADVVAAAGPLLRSFFSGGGPEQLPLPLDVA